MNEQKKRLGTMIDCSRNGVMTVSSLKKWMRLIADMGYNTLLLYTEDTYTIPEQPCFGYLRGRYSPQELQEIDQYASTLGMEVIPCIQTLAHMKQIMRWADFQELIDIDDILLADEEKFYTLIDNMFKILAKCFTTRTINIGMDEAHHIGRGRYQDKHGHIDHNEVFLSHLNRVSKIAKKYDFQLIMWSDMFFRLANGGEYYVSEAGIDASVAEKIPENVQLIYWDYYSTDLKRYDSMLSAHEALKKGTWFAGGLWSWAGQAPKNGYSMAITAPAIAACKVHNINNVFFTMWGDDGGECSKFALLPSLFYAACLSRGVVDPAEIKEQFFKMFDVPFDDFMLLDLPGTPSGADDCVQNPEKYMLYNDCFSGVFDCTVAGGEGELYATCATHIKGLSKKTEWSYLFDTMGALCDVMSLKYELGVRTRAAYQSADRNALREIAQDYGQLAIMLEQYYVAFRNQWFSENKPDGFEIQDLRLGGLIRRITHCRIRILAYANGETDSIRELDDTILDLYGTAPDHRKPLFFNNWRHSVSTNVVSFPE